MGTNLSRLDLSGTQLSEAKVNRVDLSKANLNAVDFRRTNLIGAILDEATITGAKLWETQRDGWSIKDVICEHAFWDKDAEEPTEYAPREFERLYHEAATIELHYEGGMNRIEVNTLPMLLQHLEAKHEGCVLRLESVVSAAGGAKARIVVDEAGGHDPRGLVTNLQEEADATVLALRRNLQDKEEHLKLAEHELGVLYGKVFPMLSESKSMSGDKQIHIGSIGTLGSLGDISGNTNVQIDQSAHDSPTDLTTIKDLVTEILEKRRDLESDIGSQQLIELEASARTIAAQVSQPNPDTPTIKTSLATVKRIVEGATANVLASGWLKVLEGLV